MSEPFNSILEEIASELELRPLLTSIITRACGLLGAEGGAIGLYVPRRHTVQVEAIHQLPLTGLGLDFEPGEGLIGKVLATGRSVIVDRYGVLERTSLPELHDNAVIGVPIHGLGGGILKDVTKSDFVTALRTVAGGQTWLHPLAQRSLVEQLRNRQADPLALLTQRERSVLELIARGMSNRQIGDELHLTEGTVKGYVSTILAKLKLADRTQAALFAVQRGLGRR